MSNPAPIPPEELRAMEKRCEAATPGPWYWETVRGMRTLADGLRKILWSYGDDGDLEGDDTDEAFIAHARTDLPRLLAAHRALVEERDALLERVTDLEAELQGERDFAGSRWAPDPPDLDEIVARTVKEVRSYEGEVFNAFDRDVLTICLALDNARARLAELAPSCPHPESSKADGACLDCYREENRT